MPRQTSAQQSAKAQEVRKLDEALQLANEWCIRQSRQDFNSFAQYVFHDTKKRKPLVQGALHRGLQQCIDENDWVFVELPRDHGKTTQLVIRVLWWLGHNPNELIKIACETDNQAKARIREISEHILNNDRLHEVFPHLRPADIGGWTQHGLYVQREVISRDASVEAYGIEAGVVGGRATKLVFDDVTKPKSVRSEVARAVVKDSFYGVWLPMMEESDSIDEDDEVGEEDQLADPSLLDLAALPDSPPDGQMEVWDRKPRGGKMTVAMPKPGKTRSQVVWIGTPWHADDLHCELRDKARKEGLASGWMYYSRAVGDQYARAFAKKAGEVEDDFSPAWPERWSRKKLQSRRRRMGLTHFARAYWLKPISSEDKIWDRSDFKLLPWTAAPREEDILGIIGCWDFAFTKKTKNDASAYTAVAVTINGDIVVFRSTSFRKGFLDTARRMITWCGRDGLDHLGFEATQAQSWMGEYVQEMQALPLRPLRPKADKIARAMVTQPYVEQGRVYFMPGTEGLQDQMDIFPVGKHDDEVDTLVYCILLAIQFYLRGLMMRYGGQDNEWDDWDDDDNDDKPGIQNYEDDQTRITMIGGGSGGGAPSTGHNESVLDKVRWG